MSKKYSQPSPERNMHTFDEVENEAAEADDEDESKHPLHVQVFMSCIYLLLAAESQKQTKVFMLMSVSKCLESEIHLSFISHVAQ